MIKARGKSKRTKQHSETNLQTEARTNQPLQLGSLPRAPLGHVWGYTSGTFRGILRVLKTNENKSKLIKANTNQ